MGGKIPPMPFWSREKKLIERYEPILGTVLEIQITGRSQFDLTEARDAALREIERLEPVFSVFDPASELNRFSATDGELFRASGSLAAVLRACHDLWEVSDGAFHPMAGALAQVHRAGGDVLETVDLLKRPPFAWAENSFRKTCPLPINLNAAAKGFIVDRAAQAAFTSSADIGNVSVNIGGDICHMGSGGLSVKIADPRSNADNAEQVETVVVSSCGFASSGSALRPVNTPSGPVSHIFDPRTGQPVNQFAGVSVIAGNALEADLWATVLMVLAPHDGIALTDDHGAIEFLAIGHNCERIQSPGWAEHWQSQRDLK